jgi:Tfp pilus assembly protein FimV
MSRFRMSYSRRAGSLTLTAALAALAPLACLAQSNAPLTGNMTGGAPAAGATAPASTLPQAQLPQAQLPQRPVVQQVQTPMPQPAAQAAPAAPAASAAAPQAAAAQAAAPAAVEENFGDVTRALLAAQADGRRAGGALPVLGPVSTAAWNRYLESFSHPIPEYFQKRVQTKNTN